MTKSLADQIKPGAYLVFGLPGTGKSTVSKALRKLGFSTIETDTAPGLSAWVDIVTGHRLSSLPSFPLTQDWRNRHRWEWDEEHFNGLLSESASKPTFFCGDADNLPEFFPVFRRRFALYVDNKTMSKRLKTRDPIRWNDHDPELREILGWNNNFVQTWKSGAVAFVDANQTVEATVHEILAGASA